MLLPWLLVFGIIGFIKVKNCNFPPLLFLPFFLDFSWLMLRALQNLEPIYRSSWVLLQGLLYISANASELLLFELTDFVDFCWAVTIWKLMRNLHFSEIHWVLTIEGFCSYLTQLYGENLFICIAMPSWCENIIYAVFDRDPFSIQVGWLELLWPSSQLQKKSRKSKGAIKTQQVVPRT